MSRAEPLTGEEIVIISQLLSEGYTRREISEETGRSEATVQRIAVGPGYSKVPCSDAGEKMRLLMQHWPPVVPKKKPVKRESNFRTPYRHPRRIGGEK